MKKIVLTCSIIFSVMCSVNCIAQSRTAFVHLFEWGWDDIAIECEEVLGPKGFSAVQVSPPQKSIEGSQWWTRYQPVSYAIEGRSGDRAQFSSMVSRCQNVGVDIYVDTVINHMAAHDRNFPEVPFNTEHFHSCTSDINYQDRWQVQNCDLVGLNDLKTEDDYVRQKIADYMNDLIYMGVKGFRIDAAKHIPADDIAAIKSKLSASVFIFQEVIGAGGEPIQPSEYVGNGSVTEFNFERTMGHYFKGNAPLKELVNIGIWDGWLDSSQAVTFVSNHDDQRQNAGATLTFKDVGDLYYIGEIFSLAYPYGYPKVMSSYYFDSHDQGPPSQGPNTGDSCGGAWVCEHRWRGIANMVAFRNYTADQFVVSNWWDNDNNQIAFGRGDKGFVVINREDNQALTQDLQTGMAEGTYCDIVNGEFDASTGQCDGPVIQVNADGSASFSVPAISASAIHVGALVSGGCVGDCPCISNCPPDDVEINFNCGNGSTYWGQSVYVVGSVSELGSWSPASAIKLDATSYPTWTGSVTLANVGAVEWKCLKRDEANVDQGIEWQGGSNNTLDTATQSAVTGSF